jgi:hypothetical protein
VDEKLVPNIIAVFGAAAHIGRSLARFIRFKAPETILRLITSNAGRRQEIMQEFPEAEIVIANYLGRNP